jgi:hypothetical protein
VIVVEGVASLIMGLLPWVFISSHGLVGAGMAFFYGYLSYLGLMLLIARRRAGVWLDGFTLAVSLLGAGVLWLSGLVAAWLGGGWSGLVPAAVVSLVCAGLYLRVLGQEATPANPPGE